MKPKILSQMLWSSSFLLPTQPMHQRELKFCLILPHLDGLNKWLEPVKWWKVWWTPEQLWSLFLVTQQEKMNDCILPWLGKYQLSQRKTSHWCRYFKAAAGSSEQQFCCLVLNRLMASALLSSEKMLFLWDIFLKVTSSFLADVG